MNDEEHAQWTHYFRAIADALGLKDWEIVMKRDKADAGTFATITAATGRKSADVRLGDAFHMASLEEQRSTAVHELLHLHTDPIDTAIWQVKEQVGGDALEILRTNVRGHIEFAVDGIAVAIADRYPYPDFQRRGDE